MEQSLKTSDGVFSRCDTCYKNFLKSICELNCSPHQNRFLEPAEIVETENDDGDKGKILLTQFYAINF